MPTTSIPHGSRPNMRTKQTPPPKKQLANAKADAFKNVCKVAGLPEPVTEYRFHESRKWRFDYAFVAEMVAVEVEGGAWVGGRHTRGSGFVSDMEKYNEATALGWLIIRCVPKDLQNLQTIHVIQRAIKARVTNSNG